MKTNWQDDPILGDDGYPSDEELQRIREWPYGANDSHRGLMEYVRLRWNYGDWGFSQDGDRFRLATGGWSGNESIIGALHENMMFSALCALSWFRGGLYFFDVQRWDDNPDKDKRLRVRDVLTPVDENGDIIECDHV